MVDLPAVVELGRRHVAGTPEAPRIDFHVADLRRDPIPTGYDAICFKSVLHDWPGDDMFDFFVRARQALLPGGRLCIVERGMFLAGSTPLPFSATANVVFSGFYNPGSLYPAMLNQYMLENITHQQVDIEMPFFVSTGTKP